MFSNHFELKFEGDFMQSKMYRLREFIDPRDEHSLIVDASAGLSLGPLPGLEKFSENLDVAFETDGLTIYHWTPQ